MLRKVEFNRVGNDVSHGTIFFSSLDLEVLKQRKLKNRSKLAFRNTYNSNCKIG